MVDVMTEEKIKINDDIQKYVSEAHYIKSEIKKLKYDDVSIKSNIYKPSLSELYYNLLSAHSLRWYSTNIGKEKYNEPRNIENIKDKLLDTSNYLDGYNYGKKNEKYKDNLLYKSIAKFFIKMLTQRDFDSKKCEETLEFLRKNADKACEDNLKEARKDCEELFKDLKKYNKAVDGVVDGSLEKIFGIFSKLENLRSDSNEKKSEFVKNIISLLEDNPNNKKIKEYYDLLSGESDLRQQEERADERQMQSPAAASTSRAPAVEVAAEVEAKDEEGQEEISRQVNSLGFNVYDIDDKVLSYVRIFLQFHTKNNKDAIRLFQLQYLVYKANKTHQIAVQLCKDRRKNQKLHTSVGKNIIKFLNGETIE
jgi:hypothetical protein